MKLTLSLLTKVSPSAALSTLGRPTKEFAAFCRERTPTVSPTHILQKNIPQSRVTNSQYIFALMFIFYVLWDTLQLLLQQFGVVHKNSCKSPDLNRTQVRSLPCLASLVVVTRLMWPLHVKIHAIAPKVTHKTHVVDAGSKQQPYCWYWNKTKVLLLMPEQNKSHAAMPGQS